MPSRRSSRRDAEPAPLRPGGAAPGRETSPTAVVILPLYAAAIWMIVAYFRRRWQAFVVIALSVLPVGSLTHLCLSYIPLKSGEPKPSWIYALSAAYAVLIVFVSLVIAVQRRRAAEHHCHACHYDLRGLTSARCPECGSKVRRPRAPAAAPDPVPVVAPFARRAETRRLARRLASRGSAAGASRR